jgi:hypothetical protein
MFLLKNNGYPNLTAIFIKMACVYNKNSSNMGKFEKKNYPIIYILINNHQGL